MNTAVVWRLFRTEYLNQLQSIEGAFIALARYIQEHWPGYDWFPMWYGGFPFARTYQPAFHYTVAAAASVFGLSVASAYHVVAALGYALGGVAFYYLAKALCEDRLIALGGALAFSLFSPSLLLLPALRHDAAGLWNARRLQAMVVYGEAPNVSGLTVMMFALGLLHLALKRRTRASAIAAAAALAAVPAVNWPATVALTLAVGCYVAALTAPELRASAVRVAGIGIAAAGFACPFALPSTIWSTYHNANNMAESPTPGAGRWIALALLLAGFAVVRFVLSRLRASFALRFASLYLFVLAWFVLTVSWTGVRAIPQPMRFHVAMEIPLILAAMLFTQGALARWPQWRPAAAVLLAAFCLFQFIHYRQYARKIITRLDVRKTIEFQEAGWFDRNIRGGRVLAPGTVSFWMNAFTGVPQMVGCCEQSVLGKPAFIAAYITAAGHEDEAQSADFSLLWMKAFAVQAVAIGGRSSREYYKPFQFPYRFRGKLPLLWASGDDYIYRVPERAPDLARVVRISDVVTHLPENGIDVRELRPFVAALDNPALPVASWRWTGVNSGIARADMRSDQAMSIAINYHPGWKAFVGGRETSVRSDGLGLTVIEPHCSGPCAVEMRWSPGVEPYFVWAAALATMAVCGYGLYRKSG
ncbi:MAG TPA: hypothetical protein VHB50_21865 [Bryobacteraceae bacterium]|nr:hypothetical protein [Bryobacteraceae bacterium]